MTNTNVSAPKANSNAKGKAPTKAERERAFLARAIASANKKADTLSFEQAVQQFANHVIKEEGFRRVYAIHMNERFAFTLEETGCHWSVIWDSKNAKAEGSNLRPIWLAIDAEYDRLKALLADKCSNIPQVWKRSKETAFEIAFPNQKRPPRQTVAPAEKALKQLIAAYRAVASESIQTKRDEELVMAIGELLIGLRVEGNRVDLAKINQSITKG